MTDTCKTCFNACSSCKLIFLTKFRRVLNSFSSSLRAFCLKSSTGMQTGRFDSLCWTKDSVFHHKMYALLKGIMSCQAEQYRMAKLGRRNWGRYKTTEYNHCGSQALARSKPTQGNLCTSPSLSSPESFLTLAHVWTSGTTLCTGVINAVIQTLPHSLLCVF